MCFVALFVDQRSMNEQRMFNTLLKILPYKTLDSQPMTQYNTKVTVLYVEVMRCSKSEPFYTSCADFREDPGPKD